MNQLPTCPKCQSPYTYEDGFMYICPECSNEWQDEGTMIDNRVLDAYGQELIEGDSIIVLKDLKVKGSSAIVKQGTKVKNIRIVEGDHNIDCKIDGIGAMGLKSEFVKKA